MLSVPILLWACCPFPRGTHTHNSSSHILGNGLTETWQVNEHKLPTSISAGSNFFISFSWDAVNGNLQSRTDYIKSLTESFQYDEINRLTNITSDGDEADVTYDTEGKGLILTKSDAGYQCSCGGSNPNH